MPTRLAVGCMTGTSLDALDSALVEIDGAGLTMRARLLRTHSAPLGELGARLRALAEQRPAPAGEIAAMMRDLDLLHASAVAALLAGQRADLVCVHGQTVFHKPPLSWQLFQPANLAAAVGAPVVFDLRQADLAAGGQGAPITPLADWILYRDQAASSSRACILNLGGYCNYTSLPAGDDAAAIAAGDLCPCNHLLDGVARSLLRAPFDQDGRAASSGAPDEEALEDLLGVLTAAKRPGRSLGTGDELTDWIARHRHRAPGPDLARTACIGIAEHAAERLPDEPLLLAGGGARNAALVAALSSAHRAHVRVLEDAHAREAACFAVLGALCQDRVPITLPQVTGCTPPAPIAGVWRLP